MNSTRPYLVRAFYEWIKDNSCTPYIVVNASLRGVKVPAEHVEKGQIVLNISYSAVEALHLGNDAISFTARFSGVAQNIYVPISALMAIYARENGRGMIFNEEDDSLPPPPDDHNNQGEDKGKGGHLKIVK